MPIRHITMTDDLKNRNEQSELFMGNYPGTFKAHKMFVTACQVFILESILGTKTRALCRLILNDQFQLTGLRIVDGANNLFVAYPNDPNYKGEDYSSLMYPITRELRDHIEYVLLNAYYKALETKNG
jgi:stage V sporulation protein G